MIPDLTLQQILVRFAALLVTVAVHGFAGLIARASADVRLRPGDLFGSGTVGTGCLLELTKAQGPWLQPGDLVELEIERLGVLSNRIGPKA